MWQVPRPYHAGLLASSYICIYAYYFVQPLPQTPEQIMGYIQNPMHNVCVLKILVRPSPWWRATTLLQRIPAFLVRWQWEHEKPLAGGSPRSLSVLTR